MGQSFDLSEKVRAEEISVPLVKDDKEILRHVLLSLDEEYLDLRGRLRQKENQISSVKLEELSIELNKLKELMKMMG
ncbi:MAG TPA: hypothetical protein DDZ91_01865 [Firmicutes bacterium]|nr:hypothetical protein [Bacillota bacterium]